METTLNASTDMLGSRPQRLLGGIAVSVAVHALLLLAWRHSQLAQRAEPVPEPPRTIAVWVQPPPPPPVPAPTPVKEARQGKAQAKPAAKPRTNVIAVAPKPAPVEEPSAPFAVEPPAPTFDPEAAKRIARQVANEPDPAKAGTALERLPKKELQTETKAARAIASAKRRDCKDGVPGGLLAPLFLLMDKKDGGCKW